MKHIPRTLYVSLALLSGQVMLSQSSIPDSHFRCAAQVDVPNMFPASGFYLSDSVDLILVTAKHVLFDTSGKLLGDSAVVSSLPAEPSAPGNIQIHLDLPFLLAKDFVRKDSSSDIACILVGRAPSPERGYRLVRGVQFRKGANGALALIPRSMLRPFSAVIRGNEVYTVGYPSSLGIRVMPQFDHMQPLYRKGIIAGTYEKAHTIILDLPIFYGNSGGIVIQASLVDGMPRYHVVGVISQWIPFDQSNISQNVGSVPSNLENSGYSVATSLDGLFHLIPFK